MSISAYCGVGAGNSCPGATSDWWRFLLIVVAKEVFNGEKNEGEEGVPFAVCLTAYRRVALYLGKTCCIVRVEAVFSGEK
jgi:hypothetical protein